LKSGLASRFDDLEPPRFICTSAAYVSVGMDRGWPDEQPRISSQLPSTYQLNAPSQCEMRFKSRTGSMQGYKLIADPLSSQPLAWGLFGVKQLEDLLRRLAITLEPILGCVPSSGLVAVHAALQLAERVSVYRMPLKPSFVRPVSMSSRKPLPCAFHNWLGERRLGLSLLRESGPGRLFWDSLTPEALTDSGEPTDSDPLTMLENLFGQAQSDQEDEFVETLEWLAGIERRAWACSAEETRLTTLERNFFLSRHNPVTPNWWLFSNRLSAPLDAVLQRLMVCQFDLMGS
jgi:hypothetical protein